MFLVALSCLIHAYSHARAAVFLLHIALEVPIAIQGVWSPATLPFLQLNNTTLVIVKVCDPSCGVSPLRIDLTLDTLALLSPRSRNLFNLAFMLLSTWYTLNLA